MKSRVFLALVLGLPVTAVHADQLDINLSNKTAFAQFGSTLSNDINGQTNLELGALYTESGDLMGRAGIALQTDAGSDIPGLTFGLSVRLYGVSLDAPEANLIAAAIGGSSLYRIGGALGRVAVIGHLNYAPDIITFGDAENLMETGARVEYQVSPGAAAYIGYRLIRIDVKGSGNAELDNSGHLGLRMSF